MSRLKALTILVPCLLLSLGPAALADVVTDWNAITTQTIVAAGASHGSAVSLLDNAVVQVAVYDAVMAYGGRFQPYHVHISGASGSVDAAVATAAYEVLVNRFSG